MVSNPGTLNAFELATLLTFLSDDTVENTPLETLQKKLNSAFNTKDHVKVSTKYLHKTRFGFCTNFRIEYNYVQKNYNFFSF